MTEFSFEVDSILDNGMLCGRNTACEIPVGFVFKTLKKVRFEKKTISDFSRIELGVVAEINLRIREVHCMHRILSAIPANYTACLVVSGVGCEFVQEAICKRKIDECLYLTV